jgi:hypothetical protein
MRVQRQVATAVGGTGHTAGPTLEKGQITKQSQIACPAFGLEDDY